MTTTRMAAGRYNTPDDMRRNVVSPRPKTRGSWRAASESQTSAPREDWGQRTRTDAGAVRTDNKDTLCRNITIYGHCRYQDSGCTFNHDTPPKNTTPGQPQNDM
jgi:PAB-dependent poly(A)-specific ribonuclease subunit 3